MKHIVVPVDFSGNSDNAAKYAVSFARQFSSSRITLLHVFHVPVIDPMTPQEYLNELSDSAEKEADKKMEALKEILQRQEGAENITFDSLSVMGFAVEEVLKTSEKLSADAIIMGSRHTEGKGMLLGSVASAILEKSKVPVIIVPGSFPYQKGFKHVMYAMEYDRHDVAAIEALLKFTKPSNARIHCVHVQDENEPDLEYAEKLLDDFFDHFEKEREDGYVTFKNIEDEMVTAALMEYADDAQIDMIVMLTEKRPFLIKLLDKSMTKEMAFHADIPIMAFHKGSFD